jgi:ubiquinone/menaquinone biosynthesis C-methylase UbiE
VRGTTERFNGRANTYARYRERYDAAIVLPLLREWCGLTPEWNIADIGAGTGMLSEVFLANGNRVVAVEPNTEMRAACAQEFASEPRLQVLDGTAEATGLADNSVNMISIGRALHWFDLEHAIQEFRRILKPNGWVTVVACGRDEKGSETNEALTELFRSNIPPEVLKKLMDSYDRLPKEFSGGEYRHEEITGEMQLGWEELHGLAMSMSIAPLEDKTRLAKYEEQLQELFAKFQRDGAITIATRHWIDAGRFGSPSR